MGGCGLSQQRLVGYNKFVFEFTILQTFYHAATRLIVATAQRSIAAPPPPLPPPLYSYSCSLISELPELHDACLRPVPV